ncbi:MAG: nucleoside triphosphate pyrophosphohydrolase [Planctomycetales bacterium]
MAQSIPSPLPAAGTPPDWSRLGPEFRALCEVIARLRGPDGCPWDRVQTLDTIKPHTLEETHELLEAIDSGDDAAIVEELGDVLLQVLLDAQIGADEGRFDLVPVVEGLKAKLVNRHPHVFGDAEARTAADVVRNWERVKQQEKPRESALDGLPAGLPQLARAARLTDRAARVGYDFPHRAMLFDKLREEIAELVHELYPAGDQPDIPAAVDMAPVPDEPIDDPARQARVESEIGDILFVIANIARRWKVNPEEALRKSNAKFARRFRHIEKTLKERGGSIRESNLLEMESLYQEAKRLERKDL